MIVKYSNLEQYNHERLLKLSQDYQSVNAEQKKHKSYVFNIQSAPYHLN